MAPRAIAGVLFLFAVPVCAQEEPPVFRSEVNLVRVDVQVTGADSRAIANLKASDFKLLEEGAPRPIRNFAREALPLDVLLLLDVSGSMRIHVERIASAARTSLAVLGEEDRVAIMVFDRSTRVRLPFRDNREDVVNELERLLDQERFNGGTDITKALLDASRYVMRSARRDTRRAIVILTDDQTERERNELKVELALAEADAVLSALLTGFDPGTYSGRRYPTGSPWPGGRGPLEDIVFGRRGPQPPVYGPGGQIPIGDSTRSAGTAEIARASGGDSMTVYDAHALRETLERIRQRYALYFSLPPGAAPGSQRRIVVTLTAAAARRHPTAELRFRRTYIVPGKPGDPIPETGDEAVVVTAAQLAKEEDAQPAQTQATKPTLRPRTVNEDYRGPRGPNPGVGAGSGGGSAATSAPAQPPPPAQRGGWRRADEPSPPEPEPTPPPPVKKKN